MSNNLSGLSEAQLRTLLAILELSHPAAVRSAIALVNPPLFVEPDALVMTEETRNQELLLVMTEKTRKSLWESHTRTLCLSSKTMELVEGMDRTVIAEFLASLDTVTSVSFCTWGMDDMDAANPFFAFFAGALSSVRKLTSVRISGDQFAIMACYLKNIPTSLLPATTLSIYVTGDYKGLDELAAAVKEGGALNQFCFTGDPDNQEYPLEVIRDISDSTAICTVSLSLLAPLCSNVLHDIICHGKTKKLDEIAIILCTEGALGPSQNSVLAEAISNNQIRTDTLEFRYDDEVVADIPGTCRVLHSLGDNTTLLNLTLELAPSPELCMALQKGLGQNSSLKKLAISFCDPNDLDPVDILDGRLGMANFMEGLRINCSIEELEWRLWGPYAFNDALFNIFSFYISVTKSLKTVTLRHASFELPGLIEDPAWENLTRGLSRNKSIQSFKILNFKIQVTNSAFASSMGELKSHPTLDSIFLSNVGEAENCHPGQYLLQGVPRLKGGSGSLKELRIIPVPGLVDDQCNAFFDALWENYSLHRCSFWTAQRYHHVGKDGNAVRWRDEHSDEDSEELEALDPALLSLYNEMNEIYQTKNKHAKDAMNNILRMNRRRGGRECLRSVGSTKKQIVDLLVLAKKYPGCCFKILQASPSICCVGGPE